MCIDSEPPTVASYTEKSFSDSGYFGFFKNKMPWVGGGTVSYGRGSVTHSTVVSAIAHTPTAARPNLKPLLFTVSVDHTLKVWSLDQECLIRAQDLLNDAQGTATSKMKTWLDPSPSHLLEIIDHPIEEDHSFYLVSFSSAANGKFKFWAATHHQDGQFNELQDIYPEESFEAKPPSTVAPWIVSEFKVTPAATEGPRIFDLWILWKSDTNFQVQSVRFDITDVNSTWGQWTTATDDTLHNLPRPTAAPETVEEVTEHWKKWIFYPGRFPDTILESALRIYENNFLVPTGTNISTETIQSRAARVVSAAVHLDADSMRDEDYDAYRADMALQWDRFSRLCTELDKQRREALSLVSDPQSGFVWTVNVDGITALRECTETEAIWHNFTTVPENFTTLSNRTQGRLGAGLAGDALGDVMKLMAAANELSESLSEKVVHACSERLRSEIVNDPLLAVQDSMFKIYQQLLEPEVYDETHEKLRDIFNSIENPENAFRSMMSSLFHQPDSHVGQARLTKFGAKVLIGGTQEIIHINHQLLFQLLYLLVYVTYADYEADFLRISRPESIYHQLLGYFREYEVLNWMALSSAQLAASPVVPEDDISTALTDLHVSGETPNSRLGKRGSVLQLVLPDNFGPSPAGPGRSGLFSLSVCVRKFLAGLEISEYGNGVPHVAAALLRANATGPATDFAKFLPSTAWGTYMKGRIQLKAHNFALAAQSFNKAAYGMGMLDLSPSFIIADGDVQQWEPRRPSRRRRFFLPSRERSEAAWPSITSISRICSRRRRHPSVLLTRAMRRCWLREARYVNMAGCARKILTIYRAMRR